MGWDFKVVVHVFHPYLLGFAARELGGGEGSHAEVDLREKNDGENT